MRLTVQLGLKDRVSLYDEMALIPASRTCMATFIEALGLVLFLLCYHQPVDKKVEPVSLTQDEQVGFSCLLRGMASRSLRRETLRFTPGVSSGPGAVVPTHRESSAACFEGKANLLL